MLIDEKKYMEKNYGTRTRTRMCPVRERDVTEYVVPLEKISQLFKRAQVRTTGSQTSAVNTLSGQLKRDGQIHGICVVREDGVLKVVWGNTRYKSALQLEAESDTIKGLPHGHIWASVYDCPVGDMLLWQVRENNKHPASTLATEEDNQRAILKLIKDNTIFGYEKMTPKEQKQAFKALYKSLCMPEDKVESCWNYVQKRDSKIRAKCRPWEKTELAKYYGRNNPYGILPEDCKKSGDVFVCNDGVKRAVYYIIKPSEFSGALIDNVLTKVNTTDVKECIVVASLNHVNPVNIPDTRKKVIAKMSEKRSWVKQPSCFARISFAPQTESEQDNELLTGDFLSDYLF